MDMDMYTNMNMVMENIETDPGTNMDTDTNTDMIRTWTWHDQA
jgi:hypothetical protein